jgi:hypothetical protein
MVERRPSQLTGISAALLAFLFYGGWAFMVNYPHGAIAAVAALAVQGAASFATTLVLTKLVTFFYRRLAQLEQPRILWLSLPPVLSTAVVACLLVLAHTLAGTPTLLATIAPSVVIGFAFGIYCTYDLVRVACA